MRISGIISEYNPLHNGHIYHIEKTKELTNCDGLIVAMSGNFTQRGEPALLDKWTRAKCALESGADLVLEIPTPYAISSAESFCFGGVSLLNSLNIVDYLSFGSEAGALESLDQIATCLCNEPEGFKKNLKKNLDLGLSFPKSRENALKSYLNLDNDISNLISSSNNILAIEYLKALKKLKSNIKPVTITRVGAAYNSLDILENFSSASGIRNFLESSTNLELISEKLPLCTLDAIKNDNLVFTESMFKYLKYKILTSGHLLKDVYEVTEGIDNKIINEFLSATSYSDAISRIKSKRYTYSRISRVLCRFFIGLETADLENILKEQVNYVRILGFNNTGRQILKEIKQSSTCNIITSVGKYTDNPVLDLDIKATKAYSLLNSHINPLSDLYNSPVILSE